MSDVSHFDHTPVLDELDIVEKIITCGYRQYVVPVHKYESVDSRLENYIGIVNLAIEVSGAGSRSFVTHRVIDRFCKTVEHKLNELSNEISDQYCIGDGSSLDQDLTTTLNRLIGENPKEGLYKYLKELAEQMGVVELLSNNAYLVEKVYDIYRNIVTLLRLRFYMVNLEATYIENYLPYTLDIYKPDLSAPFNGVLGEYDKELENYPIPQPIK